ncbi:MAG: protein-disulfide reductase DsbD N-terminal domain-containing protein [Betaproteobacteria bacterium]|nr:protein-disulfide reductase DsbD N-terminal domain-containing protein [Betaproteobacteria bacterium]
MKPYLKLFVLAPLALGMLQPSFAEEPLPPDEAFKLKVSFKDKNTLAAELAPAKNHYLYKDKVRFAVKGHSGVLIKEVQLPPGEVKKDQFFGTMETYKKPMLAAITLDRAPKAKGFTLLATYQGCNEKLGVCYPPIEKSFDLVLP